MRNPSISPTTSSQITNLFSDQVTSPWTCCSYSPNRWRHSMSNMKSGPSLDIISCFWYNLASCLTLQTMASQANSTNGFLTSSTLGANVWLSTESLLLFSLSRLECHKAVFWASSYSWSSSMISLTGKSSICWRIHPLPWRPSSFRKAGCSLFPLFRLGVGNS